MLHLKTDGSIVFPLDKGELLCLTVLNNEKITIKNIAYFSRPGASAHELSAFFNTVRMNVSCPPSFGNPYILTNCVTHDIFQHPSYKALLIGRAYPNKDIKKACLKDLKDSWLPTCIPKSTLPSCLQPKNPFLSKVATLVEKPLFTEVDFVIHDKKPREWMVEYVEHVEEIFTISPFVESSQHIEFSAGPSTVQEAFPPADVLSIDSNMDMIKIASELGHDVKFGDNQDLFPAITGDHALWINYTTDENPYLPLQMASDYPDNEIIVIDTKHNFFGLPLYHRLSPESNIYIRNIKYKRKIQNRLTRQQFKWVDCFKQDDKLHITDINSVQLVQNAQRQGLRLFVSGDLNCIKNLANPINYEKNMVKVSTNPVYGPYSEYIHTIFGIRFKPYVFAYNGSPVIYVKYGTFVQIPSKYRTKFDEKLILCSTTFRIEIEHISRVVYVKSYVPDIKSEEMVITQKMVSGAVEVKTLRMKLTDLTN